MALMLKQIMTAQAAASRLVARYSVAPPLVLLAFEVASAIENEKRAPCEAFDTARVSGAVALGVDVAVRVRSR